MKNRDVIDALSNIDFDLIEDAGRVTRKMSMRQKVARWSSFAACVCLVLALIPVLFKPSSPPTPGDTETPPIIDNDVYTDDILYGTISEISTIMAKRTFEEICQQANEIVSATYLGGWIEDGRCFLTFEILERYKGDANVDTVTFQWTRCSPVVYGESVSVPFMKGKPYLLILNRYGKSVYNDEFYKYSYSPLIIPLNQLHNSKLLDRSLADEIADPNAMKNAESLIQYMLKLAENAPNISCREIYISSDNLEDVIQGTSHVLKIRVDRLVGGYMYHCTVEKVYKGDANLQEEEVSIALAFPGSRRPEIGETWIVVVEQYPDFYYLTSRQGVLDVSKEEEVVELLSKQK